MAMCRQTAVSIFGAGKDTEMQDGLRGRSFLRKLETDDAR